MRVSVVLLAIQLLTMGISAGSAIGAVTQVSHQESVRSVSRFLTLFSLKYKVNLWMLSRKGRVIFTPDSLTQEQRDIIAAELKGPVPVMISDGKWVMNGGINYEVTTKRGQWPIIARTSQAPFEELRFFNAGSAVLAVVFNWVNHPEVILAAHKAAHQMKRVRFDK